MNIHFTLYFCNTLNLLSCQLLLCRVTVVKVALLALQDLLVTLDLQVAVVHLEKLVKEDFR